MVVATRIPSVTPIGGFRMSRPPAPLCYCADLEITVISRDRGGGHGQAATKAAPQAVQVANRWHLIENASATFLDAVRRSMRSIRQVLGSTVIDPTLPNGPDPADLRRAHPV